MSSFRYIGRCKTCRAVHTLTSAEHIGRRTLIPCRNGCTYETSDRVRSVVVARIMGRVSPTVRCDARCTNAVGPSCDCSCGGENHGAGHEVPA